MASVMRTKHAEDRDVDRRVADGLGVAAAASSSGTGGPLGVAAGVVPVRVLVVLEPLAHLVGDRVGAAGWRATRRGG